METRNNKNRSVIGILAVLLTAGCAEGDQTLSPLKDLSVEAKSFLEMRNGANQGLSMEGNNQNEVINKSFQGAYNSYASVSGATGVADFKGFTHYATSLPPEKLVESIDFYFSKFDQIMEEYGLEKIKTVGDAYMCAAGLPFPTNDHAYKMILAAFDIAEFVNESKEIIQAGETRFDIRIGINTGPIVAGVVGSKKFAYDIWGDTVNIAARMESNSEPGKINISENTYELIKDKFNFEYRGEIEVKYKGMMKMYFVNSLKKSKSASEMPDALVVDQATNSRIG